MKPAAWVVVMALLPVFQSCKKTDPPASVSGQPQGAAAVRSAESDVEREARDAALAEVAKHWARGPEGWTTAITSGSPYAPDHYLRQFRELVVHSVEPQPLEPSDQLNGIQWAGQVWFEKMPYREAGDSGLVADGMVGLSITRQRGRWSQWVDFQPQALRVLKVSGQWRINPDTFLLRGKIPGPQDLSNAQVR